MRLLVLLTDAFGGRGGIAKFNRDLLAALCASPVVESVVSLPRLMCDSHGEFPPKLQYDTSGVGGKLRYLRAVLRVARGAAAPLTPNSQPSTAFDLVLCGHINLLPAAFLAHLMLRRRRGFPLRLDRGEVQGVVSNRRTRLEPPVVLVIHGIDAWQPTRSWLANRLVRSVDAFISVSEFTRQRFLSWAKLEGAPSFILPNCVDLERFTPGPRSPALLERYGLSGRTVLLTVARLSAQERYKGVDEILNVLPELAKAIPNLSYLIVGDGTDRARLVEKARSLALRVEEFSGQRFAARDQTSSSRPPTSQLSTINSQLPMVIFAGHIAEAEKVDHYRLGDAFVMPGWGEGFGIVYLEALACGIPVVASKADASREVVQDGNWGVVVDPKNRDEIREGILRALQSSGRVSIRDLERYSFARYCERGQAILLSLAGTQSAGRVVAAPARACSELK